MGDTSWIQYGDNATNRTAIAATRTSIGTFPKGSQWTKNPIPACEGTSGGVGTPDCPAPQFDPPLPGLFGYGGAACFKGSGGAGGDCTKTQDEYWNAKFYFNVIDKVQIPAGLKQGEYVLSFRWDSEQTPQVWAQCADITIGKYGPSPAPSTGGGLSTGVIIGIAIGSLALIGIAMMMFSGSSQTQNHKEGYIQQGDDHVPPSDAAAHHGNDL